MVRSSGPVRTCALALALTRGMSCTGTGSIQSTSPDRRAATRVASDPMGVKITSVRLCSGLFHQVVFGVQIVLTPGWWLSMRKGPVPFSFRAA